MRILTLLSLIGISFSAFGQMEQIKRVEVEWEENKFGTSVVLGNQGVVLLDKIEVKGNNDDWNFTLYDKELKKTTVQKIAIPDKFLFQSARSSSDKIKAYALFANPNNGESIIVVYDALANTCKSHKLEKTERVYTERFYYSENGLFVIGKAGFSEEMIFKVDELTGACNRITVHTGLEKLQIENIESFKNLDIAAIISKASKGGELCIDFFDLNSNRILFTQKLPIEAEKKILTANVTMFSKEHYLISGTYSSNKNNKANGIFVSEYKNSNRTNINYTSFTDLNNFNEFLSGKKKENADEKTEKKKEKGKEDFVEARVYIHPIFNYQGQYILVGEVYRETSASSSNSQGTVSVFDGYLYTHAIIIGMDLKGIKKWDYCFTMDIEDKPMKVKQIIQSRVVNDEISLFYSNDVDIKTFVIKGSQVTEKISAKIEQNTKRDKELWSVSDSEFWYDNYFLSFGMQEVLNNDNSVKKTGVKRKRIVYYFVKNEIK